MFGEGRSDSNWSRGLKPSRRGFILGTAGVLLGGAAAAVAVRELGFGGQPDAESGLVPVSMAMHIHASASEGPASMYAQLTQAAKNAVDVLWWTEHDDRMSAHDAATQISFLGLTETPPGAAEWTWTPSLSGKAPTSSHLFCTTKSQPDVGDRGTAVRFDVVAAGAGAADHRLSGQSEDLLNRTSLSGLSISFDVFPTDTSATSYLSIDIVTSFRPASGTLPAGQYTLSYRVGGGATPGSSKVTGGTAGVLTLAAPKGEWTTLTITPASDLSRLWPGVDGQDASLYEFSVGARSSVSAHARGYFANLQFERATAAGNQPLEVQTSLCQRYAPEFPTVRQFQALEVSLTTPHLGWYGGKFSLPDYADAPARPSTDPGMALAAVQRIHKSGGLASYCHPFGTTSPILTAAEQEQLRVAKSSELVGNRALGCDLLEVGYRLRGGCTLDQHVSVWDNCSRNLIYLTGLGVSDDHQGQDWLHSPLNFISYAWATDISQPSLLTALSRGQIFFGDLAAFKGRLNMSISGQGVMGAVTVTGHSTISLTLHATGLPKDATIDLVRGTVDLAGAANTTPELVHTSIPFTAVGADGTYTSQIDLSASRFVRFVVIDAQGVAIAFTNPVWLLREEPTSPIPPKRLVSV